jgi:hypothetical protein
MLNQRRLVMVFDPTVRGKSLTCRIAQSIPRSPSGARQVSDLPNVLHGL